VIPDPVACMKKLSKNRVRTVICSFMD